MYQMGWVRHGDVLNIVVGLKGSQKRFHKYKGDSSLML